jgi:integrase
MENAGNVTDKNLRSWLNASATARGIGNGLTFVTTESSAERRQASWLLRYRFAGVSRALVLGRYPDLSLKDARELARNKRAQIQQGTDVAMQKQVEKLASLEEHDVAGLAQAWFDRHIANRLKHPGVVERVIRRHIKPAIGKLPISEVRPAHIDLVLTRIVTSGAPTVANDAMRYLFRMFHFAAKRSWIEFNPVSGFDISDAGGTELARERWLNGNELALLMRAMRETDSFGRQNELAVWLLLALCVRKMELVSAKWDEFDLKRGVWSLKPSRTKKKLAVEIPLAPPVLRWLAELKVFANGSEHLFPARLLIRMKFGVPRKNRFAHISPDTLNAALKRLPLKGIDHFTVHDMRRTARTHLAAMGVGRDVAERALNHKMRDIEGVYNKHDYFAERKEALSRWADALVKAGQPAA